ncbi:MAG: hypothetical protein EBZ13_06720 [Planctomycetia bacterium]|nr:hypothetical protein [Planctomycetia bacterium]
MLLVVLEGDDRQIRSHRSTPTGMPMTADAATNLTVVKDATAGGWVCWWSNSCQPLLPSPGIGPGRSILLQTVRIDDRRNQVGRFRETLTELADRHPVLCRKRAEPERAECLLANWFCVGPSQFHQERQ